VPDDITGAELAEVIQGIRDRVRARYPEGLAAAGVPLADLTPAVHARDAAEAKVAAIGSVNPRPAGLVHGVVQVVKKTISRALDWHVREQVEFNRAALRSLDATIEAINETNRALQALARRDEEFAARAEARIEDLAARAEARAGEAVAMAALVNQRVEELLEVRDIRAHWAEWRVAWERKLTEIEKHFFRAVSDLHGAYQNRATVLETSVRETTRIQHSDFLAALDDGLIEVQKKLRDDFERLIRLELRVIRQRTMLPQAAAPPAAAEPVAAPPGGPPLIDWLHFASRFRGPEESVREKQRFYLPYFAQCREAALDLGCGRGEFLELMKEAGAPARGVDLSAESVALCRSKGLDAEAADLFAHLRALPDNSLDGVFCAQVIEHLPPPRLPELLELIAAKLDRDGVVALETPNPDCLAIFATHFYLDPTHVHPVPSKLLKFYLEEFGMDRIEVHPLNPAEESWPAVQSLSKEFRETFFGALDYAVIAWKL
jgi:2-polyprenyl-3-methyl-5-hydroxy-6-metoxy-1,4-benzoquinol methylase